MATETGAKLAQAVRASVTELMAVCAGVDEAAASRAPAGRWSPREILSHLAGREGISPVAMLERFLAEDTPLIELVPEQTNLSEARRAMPFAELAELAARRYEAIARFAEGLKEDQFGRTARIPALAQSPLGEYPTLEGIIGGLGSYHVQMHTAHLREILAALKGQ